MVFQGFTSYCQISNNANYSSLIGVWNVLSKVEVKKSGGQIIDQEKELYKPDEKSFEFTSDGTVIITQDFGKHSEKLPARVEGKNLFIGKFKKNKIPYLIRYEGSELKLAKTETKVKKGQTIEQTEQVVLGKK